MIWFFIVLGLSIIFITLMIVCIRLDNEDMEFVCGIFCVISIGACISLGITALIMNSKIDIENTKISIEEKINKLNSDYDNLYEYYINREDTKNISGLDYNFSDINSYNNNVKELKEDIKNNRFKLNNKWINWYYSKAYLNYDGNEIKYFNINEIKEKK